MSSAATTDAPKWRPKAIVFDLLTALLDSWSLWDASTPSGTASEGRLWRGRYLELTFGASVYVPYEQFVSQSAKDVGLPESAPEALLQNWDKLQPWSETPDILQQLKTKGYKLGVVTNCSKDLGQSAARRLGRDVFDAVITAEESGFYKPTKEAYLSLLNILGLKAEDVLFVAGSAGDVEGATNAGMKVVWHNKIGLARKGSAVPLREASVLDEALIDFL